MRLDLVLISDNTDCFSLDIEDISFLLSPQIVKEEEKLEFRAELNTNTRTDLNKANYN